MTRCFVAQKTGEKKSEELLIGTKKIKKTVEKNIRICSDLWQAEMARFQTFPGLDHQSLIWDIFQRQN